MKGCGTQRNIRGPEYQKERSRNQRNSEQREKQESLLIFSLLF